MIAVTTPDKIRHLLESEAAIALIPSLNTRAAIQTAYDAGNWEDYEPPPVEIEPLPPNWPAFRLALLKSETFRTWSKLLPDTWREDLKISAAVANPDALQSVYAQCKLLSAPLATSVAEWQAIANQHAIPVTF